MIKSRNLAIGLLPVRQGGIGAKQRVNLRIPWVQGRIVFRVARGLGVVSSGSARESPRVRTSDNGCQIAMHNIASCVEHLENRCAASIGSVIVNKRMVIQSIQVAARRLDDFDLS